MSEVPSKKRPIAKGPKKRSGGNHGNGEQTRYRRGEKSHGGTVFRRGPDQIPRASGVLMLRMAFLDYRESIYKSLGELVNTPRGALAFLAEFTDRTEGKAKQVVEQQVKRTTLFAPAPAAPLSPQSDAAEEAATYTVGPDGDRMIRL